MMCCWAKFLGGMQMFCKGTLIISQIVKCSTFAREVKCFEREHKVSQANVILFLTKLCNNLQNLCDENNIGGAFAKERKISRWNAVVLRENTNVL